MLTEWGRRFLRASEFGHINGINRKMTQSFTNTHRLFSTRHSKFRITVPIDQRKGIIRSCRSRFTVAD